MHSEETPSATFSLEALLQAKTIKANRVQMFELAMPHLQCPTYFYLYPNDILMATTSPVINNHGEPWIYFIQFWYPAKAHSWRWDSTGFDITPNDKWGGQWPNNPHHFSLCSIGKNCWVFFHWSLSTSENAVNRVFSSQLGELSFS